jgi:hypothetical protein
MKNDRGREDPISTVYYLVIEPSHGFLTFHGLRLSKRSIMALLYLLCSANGCLGTIFYGMGSAKIPTKGST